ncbi:MAG: putative holin-like toxin [Tumebacillaceae bacterium]
MSTRDVINTMLQFGQFLMAVLTLIVTIIKHMMDNQNKKK